MNSNLRKAEQQLEEMILTPREKSLVALMFNGELTEEALHTLIDGLDLDTANQNYILMLSCLGHTRGWELFPAEMIPRLKGVHRYHQVHNAMGIPWLVQQLRILTDAGIPVMLLKGCAALAYYVPNTPRLMWDYDVAVPEAQFGRALQLLLTGENTFVSDDGHSVSIKGARDEIDLHRWIFKTNGERASDVWERAISFSFYGIDVCVPAPEDMLVHLLDTQSRNYFRQEGADRRMQWICDCRCIWQKTEKLDLRCLADRAQDFFATERVRMMLVQFMQCFPELIDQQEFHQLFPRTKEYDRLLICGEKYKKALNKYKSYKYNFRSAMTPLHVWRSLQMEIASYRYLCPEMRRMDPKLNFLRFFNKMHNIDSFSSLAKKYLSRIRLREQQLPGGE